MRANDNTKQRAICVRRCLSSHNVVPLVVAAAAAVVAVVTAEGWRLWARLLAYNTSRG